MERVRAIPSAGRTTGTLTSLYKRIPFSEARNLELRVEAFNVTNTPPLGAQNAVLGPGFGSITSAGDPRVIQLGIKLNF